MADTYGASLETGVTYGDQDVVRLDPDPGAGDDGRGHRAPRPGRHALDDLLPPVPGGPHVRHARPPHPRARRLERGHVGQRQRGAQLRARRAPGARSALRPRRRVHGGHLPALGQLAGRRARAGPRAGPRSPTRRKSPTSTTPASGSSRVDRSTCRAVRRAGRCIIQAGSSGRGKAFAARWAEVIFAVQPDAERGAGVLPGRQGQRGGARAARPRRARSCWRSCRSSARRRPPRASSSELHNDLADPLVGLATLSSHANYDLARTRWTSRSKTCACRACRACSRPSSA